MWRSCHQEVAQGSGRSNQLHFQEGNSVGLSCFRCLFPYPEKIVYVTFMNGKLLTW